MQHKNTTTRTKMPKVKSVFVFNTGSSSVKISLLSPPLPAAEATILDDYATREESPIRILTAHAQRLGTTKSSVLISLSSKFIDSMIIAEEGTKEQVDRGMVGSKSGASPTEGTDIEISPTKMKDAKHNNNVNNQSSHTEHRDNDETHTHTIEVKKPFMTHGMAIETILDEINAYNSRILTTVVAVGHRVVHGGAKFTGAVDVNGDDDGDSIIKTIEDVSHLAPL